MIVKIDQMNQVHAHKDDVQHDNFNVGIKIVHRYHMFVMVKKNFCIKMFYLLIFLVIGTNDCGDNSGKNKSIFDFNENLNIS
jgi:hypothetical protein